jgi:hypothetical protein
MTPLADRIAALMRRSPDDARTAAELARALEVPEPEVSAALRQYESEGSFVRLSRGEWIIGAVVTPQEPTLVRAQPAQLVHGVSIEHSQIVGFDELPAPRDWRTKGAQCDAWLDELRSGLCREGISSEYREAMRHAIGRRHQRTRQRYAIRKQGVTFTVYRLEDASAEALCRAA